MAANDHIVLDILYSRGKIQTDFPGTGIFDRPNRFGDGKISDAVCFGFSYVETADNLVSYVMADPDMIKKIITEVPDVIIDLNGIIIGKLWTADLIVSKKVRSDHIFFSNEFFGTVLDLNTNPNVDDEIGESNASI
jgi:hypothetical protein